MATLGNTVAGTVWWCGVVSQRENTVEGFCVPFVGVPGIYIIRLTEDLVAVILILGGVEAPSVRIELLEVKAYLV